MGNRLNLFYSDKVIVIQKLLHKFRVVLFSSNCRQILSRVDVFLMNFKYSQQTLDGNVYRHSIILNSVLEESETFK